MAIGNPLMTDNSGVFELRLDDGRVLHGQFSAICLEERRFTGPAVVPEFPLCIYLIDVYDGQFIVPGDEPLTVETAKQILQALSSAQVRAEALEL